MLCFHHGLFSSCLFSIKMFRSPGMIFWEKYPPHFSFIFYFFLFDAYFYGVRGPKNDFFLLFFFRLPFLVSSSLLPDHRDFCDSSSFKVFFIFFSLSFFFFHRRFQLFLSIEACTAGAIFRLCTLDLSEFSIMVAFDPEQSNGRTSNK